MTKEIKGIGLVYGAQELADLFGVSIYTVLRDYRLGRLQGRKFGRQILFTADAVKAFLESGSPTRRGSKAADGQRSPSPGDNHRAAPTLAEMNDQGERNRVLDAMKRAGNHRREAAQILGCSEVTLRNKFKKHGLTFPGNRGIRP